MPREAAIADLLEERAAASGTAQRAAKERAYLKLPTWRFHGATVPAVRKVARAWVSEQPDLDHDGLWAVVDALWQAGIDSPCWERRRLAVELLSDGRQLLLTDDLPRLEALLRDSHTWALVDELAAHAVGRLVEGWSGADALLDRWVQDPDFWIRRSALLAHLVALREGRGDWERFGRFADGLLAEKEFFIRKAIGWVLRDTSRKRPELVRDWVAARTHRMSGVSFREAVRRLPDEDQARLKAAYKSKLPAV